MAMRISVVFTVAALTAAAAIVPSQLVPLFAADCPPAVTAAIEKAHAGVAIASCKKEQENGTTQFEVKLEPKGGKRMEVDVSPDGTILLTEQSIALGDVPPAVMKALAAKYGTRTPTGAEMQTAADGKVTYEIAFKVGAKRKEATFAPDGAFVEEE
jgi:streptogramin lyase